MAGPTIMAGMAGVAPSTIMDGGGDQRRPNDERDDAEASDAWLARNAQRGDRPALEALIRRHQRAVQRLCLRYVRDNDEAADLVQRTFLRAMEGLGDLRALESFHTWVLRIAANLALNHVRDHARFVREDDSPGGDSTKDGRGAPFDREAESTLAGANADARLEAGQAAHTLRQAVHALPTTQRLTLELRVHEELSFRDIADALGTTENAAKVNFHHAVRNLKKRLRPDDTTTTTTKRRGR